jgi:hypothetical protein
LGIIGRVLEIGVTLIHFLEECLGYGVGFGGREAHKSFSQKIRDRDNIFIVKVGLGIFQIFKLVIGILTRDKLLGREGLMFDIFP